MRLYIPHNLNAICKYVIITDYFLAVRRLVVRFLGALASSAIMALQSSYVSDAISVPLGIL